VLPHSGAVGVPIVQEGELRTLKVHSHGADVMPLHVIAREILRFPGLPVARTVTKASPAPPPLSTCKPEGTLQLYVGVPEHPDTEAWMVAVSPLQRMAGPSSWHETEVWADTPAGRRTAKAATKTSARNR